MGLGLLTSILGLLQGSRENDMARTEVGTMAGTVHGDIARIDETRLGVVPKLLALTLSGGAVRMARVRALQRSIAAGAYRVSSADVAAKLVQGMQERSEHSRRMAS